MTPAIEIDLKMLFQNIYMLYLFLKTSFTNQFVEETFSDLEHSLKIYFSFNISFFYESSDSWKLLMPDIFDTDLTPIINLLRIFGYKSRLIYRNL